MEKGKEGGIKEEPPEAHDTEFWLGLGFEALPLYGQVYEDDPWEGQHTAGGRVGSRSVIKDIYCESQNKCKYKQQKIWGIEWQE